MSVHRPPRIEQAGGASPAPTARNPNDQRRNRIGTVATTKPDLDIVQELVTEFGDNASYVADLLARYRTNPEGVDEEWRAFFRDRLGETAPVTAPAPPPPGQPRPDVEPAPPKPAAAPAAPAAPRTLREGEQAEPLRGASLRVAQNMDASLAVPTATSQRLIPVKLLEENRRLINDYRASRDESKVSFTHLIAWAILRALDDFSRLNDAFDESGGAPVRIRRERVNF